MNADQIKQAELILHASNVPGRIFTYSQDAEESREMKFNYFDESIQLRRFAQDEYGTISDAYILYMISMLEYATPDAIREMLYAYARSNKLLSIAKTVSTASKGTEGSIEPRIQVLLKEGSIFRISYKVESKGGNLNSVSIYGATKATQTFVNVKLDKKIPIRSWTAAAPLSRSISGAAVSFVAAAVASRCGCLLDALMEKAVKTKELGAIQLPPRLLFNDGEKKYQVLFYPAFLGQVTSYQTDLDFEEMLKNKVQELKNYFYDCRRKEEQMDSYCVIVCEDRRDMENMRMVILQTRVLVDFGNLPKIFLTSEGAIRNIGSLDSAFLRMEQTQEEDLVFVKDTPPFVKKA